MYGVELVPVKQNWWCFAGRPLDRLFNDIWTVYFFIVVSYERKISRVFFIRRCNEYILVECGSRCGVVCV